MFYFSFFFLLIYKHTQLSKAGLISFPSSGRLLYSNQLIALSFIILIKDWMYAFLLFMPPFWRASAYLCRWMPLESLVLFWLIHWFHLIMMVFHIWLIHSLMNLSRLGIWTQEINNWFSTSVVFHGWDYRYKMKNIVSVSLTIFSVTERWKFRTSSNWTGYKLTDPSELYSNNLGGMIPFDCASVCFWQLYRHGVKLCIYAAVASCTKNQS